MKKMMMLAAMAMMALTAQAVTLTWSDGYNPGSEASTAFTGTQKATIKLTFTVNDLTTTTGKIDFFSILLGTENSAYNSIVLRHAPANNNYQALRLTFNSNGGGFSHSDLTLATGTEHTLIFTYDRAQANNLVWTLNGGAATTWTQGITLGDALTFQVNSNNSPFATVTGVSAEIVPEPTALALLALGVAGLALKRKMK